MKKKVVFSFLLLLFTSVSAQAHQEPSDTAKFMSEIRQFSRFVEGVPALTKPVADSLSCRQDTLIAHYRAIKPQLSDQQVEEYNKIKGKYAKKVLEYRGDRFYDDLQIAGDSISSKAGRVGKAVGGFFKGLFEK